MTINPVGSSGANAPKPVAQPSSEGREVGADHDGDADDAGGTVTPVSTVATVNAAGELLGAVISTKA